ncbi:MAG: hypothetical protein KC561_09880 [Myxococcales bacterium]|nr:hypothetical protein [Myxococcales bacterium]
MRQLGLVLGVALGTLGMTACAEEVSPEPVDTFDPTLLSSYALFDGDPVEQRPAEGVFAYTVNAPLFSDDALKFRFMVLPEGQQITYRDDAMWEFPLGTILVKTFAFPADYRTPGEDVRLIETRLLIFTEDGWVGRAFVWNEAQDDAVLEESGAAVPVSFVDQEGDTQSITYQVPAQFQCSECHGGGGTMGPLGTHTRQLDRIGPPNGIEENQVAYLLAEDVLTGSIPASAARASFPDPFDENEPLDDRARAYLDANCSHCHQAGGLGQGTALHLNWEVDDPARLGVCAQPIIGGAGTGGRPFAIAPGAPDDSVLIYRMETEDSDVRMPRSGNQLVDETALTLLRDWISAMPAGCQ